MCGLVGIAGNLIVSDEKVIEALLVADYIRGVDSTGLARVSLAGNVSIAKELGHPFNLIDTIKFDKVCNGIGAVAFLGHNRYATTGGRGVENAHPFQFGHIVGAHNGTLTSESFLALEKLAGQSFPVDSMAIFAAIEKVGVDAVAKELVGAFALVWADLKAGTLNFWRNSERPLWYCFSESKKHLGWASKYPFLSYAFGSHDLDFVKNKNGNCFFSFEEDTLYSWSLLELAKPDKKDPILPKERPLKAKGGTPPWLQYSSCGYSGGWWENYHDDGDPNLPIVFEPKDRKTARRYEELPASKEEPYAGMIDRSEFEDLTSYGCSFCGTKIDWGEQGITVDTVNGKVLCSGCSSSFETVVKISESQFKALSEKRDKEYLNDELPPFSLK